MALVSAVIPCYNAQGWIGDAIESIAQQGLNDLEVIVVDDGSLDNSASLVERQFGFVRLIRTQNGGPSRARNIGTEISSGRFIQYLDADDMLASGKIAAQLQVLFQTNADVAYGDWQKFAVHKGEFKSGEVFAGQIGRSPEISLFTSFWGPPAAYLFRRGIVEKVGGWNVGLPIIQDARFALDCALRGGTFVHTPGVAAYYRVHQSGSVSTRDPVGFVRDCLKNASEVEEWWGMHGGITGERRDALLEVYGGAARASFEHDRPTFEAACAALERLHPGYVPRSSRPLALVSRLTGYRRAESVALGYRRVKRALQLQ